MVIERDAKEAGYRSYRFIASTGRAGYRNVMVPRWTRIAFLAFLSSGTAPAFAAIVDPAQVTTVDVPPSQPAPLAPAPEAATPVPSPIEPTDGLALELPTIDEARAIDAAAASAPAEPVVLEAEPDTAAIAQAVAEAARLRAANSEQLAAARRQLDRIATDKQAERDRFARYREAEAAHAATMADYNAQVEAARLARLRWERDVVACQAGDRTRCGQAPTQN